MLKRILSAIFASLITCFSWAESAAMAGTESFVLDNGLKVIVRTDPRFEVVISQLWYKVGSGNERLGQTGLSHVLEHMMFNGTSHYPNKTFTETVHRLGGALNAFTHYDMTVYHETAPPKALATLFELEADRLQNLVLDPKVFANEMQVVMEERRLRLDDVPESLLEEQIWARSLVGNPYQNSVIGWPKELAHFSVEDAQKWYDTWYAPNNAVLVVVGNVDPKQVYRLAKESFGKVPAKSVPILKPLVSFPAFGAERLVVNVPAQVPSLMLAYEVPTVGVEGAPFQEVAAMTLIHYLLDGGDSARLSKSLIRDQKVVADVSIHYDPMMRYSMPFTFRAIPAPGRSIAEVEAALLAEVDRLRREPVGLDELNRAKVLRKADSVSSQDSLEQQALSIGLWENLGFSFDHIDRFSEAIEQITPEQIQAVADRYFKHTLSTIGIIEPI